MSINESTIDFGNPLTQSALDRDEAECIDNYGSISNVDVSFSGILASTNFARKWVHIENYTLKTTYLYFCRYCCYWIESESQD